MMQNSCEQSPIVVVKHATTKKPVNLRTYEYFQI